MVRKYNQLQIIAYITLIHSMEIHTRRGLAVCMPMCITVKNKEISVKMQKILTLVQTKIIS